MEDETPLEAAETPLEAAEVPAVGEGDAAVVEEGKEGEADKVDEKNTELEKGDQENADQEPVEKEKTEEVGGEGQDKAEGEHVEGESVEDEDVEGEHVEGEHVEGEHVEGEQVEGEKKTVLGEGEEMIGELEGELEEEEEEEEKVEEVVEEEEIYEEPPVDPAAPYGFTDSNEAMKAPFSLRSDQLAEVEQLWDYYQNYTPAYTDLKDFVTVVELVYMLKCLLLMPYTPEQLQELIDFCVRPPNAEGHVNFEQFVKMVTIRQRDMPIEEELRCSLEVMDPDKTGEVDREYFREVLAKQGHKTPQKLVDALVKEVDMSNDGTLGIEDIVGTMCIDLNTEDIVMLRNQIWPPEQREDKTEDLL